MRERRSARIGTVSGLALLVGGTAVAAVAGGAHSIFATVLLGLLSAGMAHALLEEIRRQARRESPGGWASHDTINTVLLATWAVGALIATVLAVNPTSVRAVGLTLSLGYALSCAHFVAERRRAIAVTNPNSNPAQPTPTPTSSVRLSAARPRPAQSSTAQPESGQLESGNPEALQPEAVQPEAVQPEAVQPGTAQPRATQPRATQAGTTQPRATQPGTTRPGTTEPRATQPRATESETMRHPPAQPTATALKAMPAPSPDLAPKKSPALPALIPSSQQGADLDELFQLTTAHHGPLASVGGAISAGRERLGHR